MMPLTKQKAHFTTKNPTKIIELIYVEHIHKVLTYGQSWTPFAASMHSDFSERHHAPQLVWAGQCGR